jgi:cytochrome c556
MTRSKLLGGVAALATIAVVASGIGVAQDAIGQRKAIMKSVGGSTKTGSQMVKGEVPYDAAKAAEAMGTIASAWANFAKLFPKGSETGGETTASPKIWESFADFDAKGKKFASDAAAAQQRGRRLQGVLRRSHQELQGLPRRLSRAEEIENFGSARRRQGTASRGAAREVLMSWDRRQSVPCDCPMPRVSTRRDPPRARQS